jgi:hypothetical protein
MSSKASVFSFIAFTFSSNKQKSRDSVVGIAPRHGLDEPGIEFRWGEIFLTRSDGPGVHPASGTVGTESLSAGWSGRDVAVTTHPLVPRSKKE